MSVQAEKKRAVSRCQGLGSMDLHPEPDAKRIAAAQWILRDELERLSMRLV